jgi:hypothetical protein
LPQQSAGVCVGVEADRERGGRLAAEPWPGGAGGRAWRQSLAAHSACEHLLSHGGGGQGTPQQRQQKLTFALKFAQCMRALGFPNLPDPTVSSQGTGFDFAGTGIDPSSPQFRRRGRPARSRRGSRSACHERLVRHSACPAAVRTAGRHYGLPPGCLSRREALGGASAARAWCEVKERLAAYLRRLLHRRRSCNLDRGNIEVTGAVYLLLPPASYHRLQANDGPKKDPMPRVAVRFRRAIDALATIADGETRQEVTK